MLGDRPDPHLTVEEIEKLGQEMDRLMESMPEARYLEGQPLPKYEINEPALREKPDAFPLELKKDIEDLGETESGKYLRGEPIPSAKQLQEPKMRKEETVHSAGDLFRSAHERLGKDERGIFIMDEMRARELKIEPRVQLKRIGEVIELGVQSTSFSVAGYDHPVRRITRFVFRPEGFEVSDVLVDAGSHHVVEKPKNVPVVDDTWQKQAVEILEHIWPFV